MSTTHKALRWIDSMVKNLATPKPRVGTQPAWTGLEPMERRVMLTADLVGFFGSNINLPMPLVPGDRVNVPIIVENIGDMEAQGEIRIDLFVVPRGGDIADDQEPIGEIEDIEGTLDSGDDAVFRFRDVIPFDEDNLPPGDYDLLAEIVVISGAVGDDPSNNVIEFIKDGEVTTTDRVEFTVAWQFGNVPGRSGNTKLIAINDDDDPTDPEAGEVVTASLTGAGYGEVIFDGIIPDGTIQFFDTDTSTKVKLTVKGGDGEVEIGSLEADEPIGSFDGKDVLLQGNADFDGGIDKLVLGNIGEDPGSAGGVGPHEIFIGGSVDDKPVTIQFGQAEDLSLTSERPIKSLKVVEWLEGDGFANALTAPSLGKFDVTGERGSDTILGNFEADLTLDGSDGAKKTLDNAKIGGGIEAATWNITGDTGKIQALGADAATINVLDGDLDSLKLGQVENTSLNVEGNVKSLEAGDWEGGVVVADSVKSIKTKDDKKDDDVNGDFSVTLNLNEDDEELDVKKTLGSAKIDGDVQEVAWSIHGDTGKIDVKGEAEEWVLSVLSDLDGLKITEVSNSNVTVDGHIKSIDVGHWDTGLISADSIGTIKTKDDKKDDDVNGDFNVGLDLNAAGEELDVKKTLGSTKIDGDVGDVSWSIHGDTGKIEIKGDVEDWTLSVMSDLDGLKLGDVENSFATVEGDVKTIETGDWDLGSITAQTLKSIKAKNDKKDEQINGDLRVTLNLTPATETKKTLGNAKVDGDVFNSSWNVTGSSGKIDIKGDTIDWALNVITDAVNTAAGLDGLKLSHGQNTSVDVQGDVKTVDAIQWDSGAIMADTVRSLKIKGDRKDPLVPGDFNASLTLHGPGVGSKAKQALDNADVAGQWGQDASITGDVNTMKLTTLDAGIDIADGDAKNIQIKGQNVDLTEPVGVDFGTVTVTNGQAKVKGTNQTLEIQDETAFVFDDIF